MSSYQRKTQHPTELHFENAEWLDDYFGQHNYGVRFPSDGKVFRADEFEWEAKPEHEGALVPTHQGGAMTIEETHKGSRFDHPLHEVENHKDGKRTITTKHEDGRQDVRIEVTRLDLKNPTPEDEAAGQKVAERLAKVAVRCVLIHKPTNDFASFECKLPEVKTAAKQVAAKHIEAIKAKANLPEGVDFQEPPLSEYVLVEYESHQVRVTTLV